MCRFPYLLVALFVFRCCPTAFGDDAGKRTDFDLRQLERPRILKTASEFLAEPPITIVKFSCPRSAGGLHDFYSEGDYWWPDPKNPDGPYVQRDGETNPDNF